MNSEDTKSLERRMNVIINLMMKDINMDAEKIELLQGMGLTAKEISEITGKSMGNVTKVFSRLKKKK